MNFDTEKKYLYVKEKLDYLRLPTVFPPEATALLHSLVNMVPNGNQQSVVAKSQKDDSQKVKAITHELQKTLKENNTLHLELIHLKEDNQVLRKRISKLESTKKDEGHKQLLGLKSERQGELEAQLKRVTSKYHELLQRAYNKENGFDNLDPEYIQKNMRAETNLSMPDKKFMQLSHQKEPTVPQQHYEEGQVARVQELKDRCDFLTDKIKNRQTEILRLQQKLQFDGVNMNKLLKDFEKSEASTKEETLNYQIDLLNKENFKLKDELKKVKGCSGHADVLRRQIQKLKENIANLKKANEKKEKQWQEEKFHMQTSMKKTSKESGENSKIVQQREKEIESLKNTIADMRKAVDFHQKEVKTHHEKVKQVKEKGLQLQTKYDLVRNNVQSEKIFLSYELEDLKKKYHQAEAALRQQQSRADHFEGKFRKGEEIAKISREQEQVKTQTIENLEEIIAEQKRIISQLKISLESSRDRNFNDLPDQKQRNMAEFFAEQERLRQKAIQLSASEQNFRSKSKKFEQISASFQVLSSQKSILQRDIKQMKVLNQELQDRLEKTYQNYSRKVEDFKAQNQRLKEDSNYLHSQIESLKAANISLGKTKEMAEFQQRKLKSQIVALNEALQQSHNIETQSERLKASLKKAESNVGILNLKISALQEEKTELIKQLDIHQAKLKGIRESERKGKQGRAALQQSLAELEEQRNKTQHELKVQTTRVNELELSITDMLKQIQSRDERLLELEEEIARGRKERARQQKRAEELTKERLVAEQRGQKQAEIVGFEKEEEIIWLRKQMAAMLEKADRYTLVNRELNDLAALTRKENEQLLQDQIGFKKQADHLRLRIHDLQRSLDEYRQREQTLLIKIQELEMRVAIGERRDDSRRNQPTELLRERVEQAAFDFQKQMRESKDIMQRK